ncbi:hypothetical protein B0H11DRAFT_1236877 [Mycena galericulata]|nr:hypothetical protein B0H11DRAFT_1236877 [Mycena galericulata]
MTYIYPDTPLTAPPVIEHWKCALVEAKITSEARTPPRSVLPPLVAFAGGHSCSYYMWFAIRSFLFPQLENPPPSPVHKTWTTEEWEAKLHNKKSGHLDHTYDARLFDKDGGSCACGVPPFDSNVLRKLSMRVDGTPVQAADFESHSLQAVILADLESGRAKLQFEQTDDIVLDILLWSPQQLSNRIEARRNIFRNSWDLSFAANPLEKADIRDRRPWITQFRDLLQEWPNFAATGPSPAALDDADSTDLDSLLAYEQRLITFYLKTVSETLGLCPALPRQRPNADALPELYRNLVP